MENKMPKLWNFKCRWLWNLLYRLHSADFAYLLYEKDHFLNLGIAGFPEIKYTGSALKITYYTRFGGMHIVYKMVNDWLNYSRKKDSYSVLAKKEFEKAFDEDLKFYSGATIKEMNEQ